MGKLFERDDYVWGPLGPLESTLKLLSKLRGKHVLVAGCGSGFDLLYFTRRKAIVTGVDLSDEQLALAKERLLHANQTAKLIQGDLNKVSALKLPKESLDLIVSSYALQYVKDLTKAFKGFFRCLKPGGTFAFSFDHPLLNAHYPAKQGKERNRDASKYIDYLGERSLSWLFNVPGKTIRAQSYYRTLSSILNSVISAGFIIELCLEPKPEKVGVKQYRKVGDFAKRVPYTLIIRARKPL